MSEKPTIPIEALPKEIRALRVLLPLATTIGTAASNPQEWLRGFVQTVVAEWFVGGIIEAAAWIFAKILWAYDYVTRIILDAIPWLEAPIESVENLYVGVVEWIFGAAQGVAHSAGLVGPPAAAFAWAIVVLLTVALLYGAVKVLPGSDFVEGGLEGIRK